MTFLLDWVRIKLNRLTAVVSPPLDTPDSPRKKVLVVHCHPEQDSLSSRLLGAVVSGLQEANHEVRVKHLYGDNDVTKTYGGGAFSPVLTAAEKNSYANPEVIRQLDTPEGIAAVTDKAVGEAIADLRWCNALVFVYPTWCFNFPATLKGYFDR
jgi:putative NADPH-quinone reductase